MCFSCNTIKDNWVITCTHSDCVIFQSTHISILLIVLLLKAIKVLKCLKITPNHIINRNFSRSVRFLCLTIIILLSHVTLHASINNHWHLSLMVPVPNCIVKLVIYLPGVPKLLLHTISWSQSQQPTYAWVQLGGGYTISCEPCLTQTSHFKGFMSYLGSAVPHVW